MCAGSRTSGTRMSTSSSKKERTSTGPAPGHHGGPGHLPAGHRHVRRTESQGCARVLGLRVLVCLHHLRRRNGHLLGPLPDIMEDQVTYPLVTAMLGAPKVKDVRGFSDFGYSYVYIIFEEGTDIYWARSRTLEYLSNVLPRLPQGVKTELGPDATGIGWVFEYALIDTTGKQSLADLRSYQDWYLRYYLKSVPGVAEVAPLGGFVRQYQVNVDPNKLQSFNIPISKVVDAVRSGNNDVGGRLVEFSGAEYMVRGRGYAQSTGDLGKIVLAKTPSGVPIRVSDVGEVTLGPDRKSVV